ncbi:GspH/FimT family pseudopilin [Shewanella youngdeokensis]|uniref:Type II secretion system protein H n=1 Tax=Shewanella youngdeokensis TaxID=2999068 RepID=A0ABZ0JWQ4_9GAMM|nr:GspH/FimT family pseudopilin [Shewanella sp. DAU334]
MNRGQYYQRAFTLVEVMVTLVIATILITIAAPSFTDFYDNSRSESANSVIKQSFTSARSNAISYGAIVVLCPLTGSTCGSDWINGFDVFIDGNANGTYESSGDQLIRSIDAFNSKDFIKTTVNTISFSAEGMLTGTSSSQRFIYCPSSKTNENARGIEVSISGKISTLTGAVNCS